MDQQQASVEQVADLLGVSIDTLKKWRSKRFRESPLYLPAIPVPNPTTAPSTYSIDVVMDFVARNPTYRDRILARFAPPDIVRDIASLPMAMAITPTQQQSPASAGKGLLGISQLQGELAA